MGLVGNQSIQTDTQMTATLEMADQYVKAVVINMFHMVKDLKDNVNVMREKNGR